MTTRADVKRLRQSIVEWAREQGPDDGFTSVAYGLNAVLSGTLGWPAMFVVPFSTAALGCLSVLSVGLLLFPFLGVLWVLNIAVVGTSWLWLNAPVTRMPVVLPGAVFAAIEGAFAAMLPYEGDWESRAVDLATAEAWPHSYHVQRLPVYQRDAVNEWYRLKKRFSDGELSAEQLRDASLPAWQLLHRTAPGMADAVLQEYNELVSGESGEENASG